jgi:hypothetical protein
MNLKFFLHLSYKIWSPHYLGASFLCSCVRLWSLGYVNNALIMCSRNEVMFEWIVNCHSYVLLAKSHKDSEKGNEKVGVEDWRKLILSPGIAFSDCGKAVETIVTVATMMIEKPWQSVQSANNEVSSGSDE